MRKCPVCGEAMENIDYEGFRVRYCHACGGHLIPAARLKAIQQRDSIPRAKLQEEVRARFTASTTEPVRCPRCRMTMRKQDVRLPVVQVQTDVCAPCGLIWLDAGELALLQLAHEATATFADRRALQQRALELETSPERKAQFLEDLSRLPDTPRTDLEPKYAAGGSILADILVEALCFLLRKR
ncbi:MAG TPA: zf-TFIIB domain-containing protein [Kiritimatiellia bacterium]|nr:zf-TFIIB domain-containing protein [Kiritimatiellia bacterium]HMP32958.1 zf-TFIIB domain-containing protein [Kiritimatiellia bacterium]